MQAYRISSLVPGSLALDARRQPAVGAGFLDYRWRLWRLAYCHVAQWWLSLAREVLPNVTGFVRVGGGTLSGVRRSGRGWQSLATRR